MATLISHYGLDVAVVRDGTRLALLDLLPDLSIFTPRALGALGRAGQIAASHGVSYVGAEHRLLAIADDDVAFESLRDLGMTRRVQDTVMEMLGPHTNGGG